MITLTAIDQEIVKTTNELIEVKETLKRKTAYLQNLERMRQCLDPDPNPPALAPSRPLGTERDAVGEMGKPEAKPASAGPVEPEVPVDFKSLRVDRVTGMFMSEDAVKWSKVHKPRYFLEFEVEQILMEANRSLSGQEIAEIAWTRRPLVPEMRHYFIGKVFCGLSYNSENAHSKFRRKGIPNTADAVYSLKAWVDMAKAA